MKRGVHAILKYSYTSAVLLALINRHLLLVPDVIVQKGFEIFTVYILNTFFATILIFLAGNGAHGRHAERCLCF